MTSMKEFSKGQNDATFGTMHVFGVSQDLCLYSFQIQIIARRDGYRCYGPIGRKKSTLMFKFINHFYSI